MEEFEKLLSKNLIKNNYYWQCGDENKKTIWDEMANENPFHAAVSAQTEEGEKNKSLNEIEILQSHLNEGFILDLGCGYGRIAKYLLPVSDKIRGYIGLDSSEVMLRLFFNRYQDNSDENRIPLILIKSSINDIPIEDNCIDNVIICACFLHNHKKVVRESIEEVYRVLKPHGKLFVFGSFPNRNSLSGIRGNLYLFLLRFLGKGYKNGPVRYFSETEIRVLLGKYSDIKIYHSGFGVLPKSVLGVPSFLNRVYRFLIFNPSQTILNKIIPINHHELFCTHFDVIAEK